MLPLDQLSAAALRAVTDAGFSPEDMAIALRLDLDFEGKFGESWLVYDQKNRSVLRLLGDASTIRSDLSPEEEKKYRKSVSAILNPDAHMRATSVSFVEALDLSYYTDPQVDNFASSNRVVFQKHHKSLAYHTRCADNTYVKLIHKKLLYEKCFDR